MAIVTTTLTKQHIGISHSKKDDLIELMIDGAQEFVERYCDIYFREDSGSVTEYLGGGGVRLRPTKKPIISVTSVVDAQNEDTEYEFENTDTAIYRDAAGTRKITSVSKAGLIWPNGVNRWKVTYTAGYDTSTVPSALKLAILDLVYRSYEGKGSKSHQSAKGFGYDWQTLAGSDILKRLSAFSYREMAG